MGDIWVLSWYIYLIMALSTSIPCGLTAASVWLLLVLCPSIVRMTSPLPDQDLQEALSMMRRTFAAVSMTH